jgi:hypothetical protein
VVMMGRSHRPEPGSTPGRGDFYEKIFLI